MWILFHLSERFGFDHNGELVERVFGVQRISPLMREVDTQDSELKTLKTSFRICELLREQGGLTLTEIADELDSSKSTIFRYMKTLEQLGFVFNHNGQYRIGLNFLRFGLEAKQAKPLWNISLDLVENLAAEIEERVWLSSREGEFTYHLYKVERGQDVRTPANIGERRHLHHTGSGKAIMAELPDGKISEIIGKYGLPPRTPHTITESDEMWEEIERIRDNGFALLMEESLEGICGISVAVTNPSGSPIGGVSVAGPAPRFTREYMESNLIDPLSATAEEIEINLRYYRDSSGGK